MTELGDLGTMQCDAPEKDPQGIAGEYRLVSSSLVKKFVMEEFGLSWDQFHRRVHRRIIVRPRQVYFYLLRKHKRNVSLNMIGRQFRMHHTTVHYGAVQMTALIGVDPCLAVSVARIEARMKDCAVAYAAQRAAAPAATVGA